MAEIKWGDNSRSITAKVGWRLDDHGVVARVEDPHAEVQRNALLDALHLWIVDCGRAGRVRLELPNIAPGVADGLATLRAALDPAIDVDIDPPVGEAPHLAAGTEGWCRRLVARDKRLGEGLPEIAKRLRCAVGSDSFEWYATLHGPLTGRVDGLVVCQLVGKQGGVVGIGKSKKAAGLFEEATGHATPLTFSHENLDEAAAVIRAVVVARTSAGSALRNLDREHRLEARVLRGAVGVAHTSGANLEVALSRSQFPCRWAVGGRARYLDVLMREGETPWAVELKVRSGGAGQYLRHGVGQAVLYRSFIRQAKPLHPYLCDLRVDPTACQAAVAFPKLSGQMADRRTREVQAVSKLFDVEVIELAGE